MEHPRIRKTFVTLENAIYMGMKNDLSFIIDLFPVWSINIHTGGICNICSAAENTGTENIVFYNGTERKEDRWENRLSEAYENISSELKLELKVVTLNINCRNS